MSLENDLKVTLSPLASGRAWQDTFPPNLQWPAIRYTFVSTVPDLTVCGSGDDTASDFRVQIDGIASSSDDRDALRLAIIAAMQTFPTPAVCVGWGKEYDQETKSFRVTLDYLILPSSP